MVVQREHLLLLEARLSSLRNKINADKNGVIDEKIKGAISLVERDYELLKAMIELRDAVEKQDFTLAIRLRSKVRAMVGEIK